VANC